MTRVRALLRHGAAIAMSRSLLACFAATSVAAQVSSPPDSGPSAPRTFALTAESSLVVRTFKDGARATLTHDHVIKATELVGEATWDERAPEATRLKVTIQTRSLLVDDAAERARFGLTDSISEKDRKAVDEALKGRDTLDARRYPTISFRSTRATRDEKGALTLMGDFTMHGVTRPVSLIVTVSTATDGRVVGEGSFSLKTSDFGVRPYSAFLGAVKVKDEVEIHVRLVGEPR